MADNPRTRSPARHIAWSGRARVRLTLLNVPLRLFTLDGRAVTFARWFGRAKKTPNHVSESARRISRDRRWGGARGLPYCGGREACVVLPLP